jgi:hypothetical protein
LNLALSCSGDLADEDAVVVLTMMDDVELLLLLQRLTPSQTTLLDTTNFTNLAARSYTEETTANADQSICSVVFAEGDALQQAGY